MRKLIFILLPAIVTLGLAGCYSLNPSERLLAGKWYGNIQEEVVTQTEESTTSLTGESTTQYNKDKTSETQINMRYTIHTSEVQETIALAVSLKGTWAIKDKTLEETCNYADVQIKSIDIQGYDTTDATELENVKASEKQRIYYDFVIPLKNNLLKSSSDRIKQLNENQLVTIDADGRITEFKRIATEEADNK